LLTETVALHRPVLSPDGNFIAVIVPELEIHILSLANIYVSHKVIRRIILPKAARNFLSNANILRWSPETIFAGESEGGKRDTTSGTVFGTTWLLLCDGYRVIALSTELQSPSMIESNIGNDDPSQSSNIVADYQIGSQYGKITLADFVFSHQHAVILFETNIYASIISLTRPQRDDILNPKYPDSRSFTQSPNNRCFALLMRSKGQDQISVFSAKDSAYDNASTFSPRTSDAQDLLWSPNGDPLLVVWDSASYGVKVSFFTAMGHSLKQLDLSTLAPLRSQAVGVITLKWHATGDSTILAIADGNNNVLIRRQDNRNMVG
jgi:hypothetical protein